MLPARVLAFFIVLSRSAVSRQTGQQSGSLSGLLHRVQYTTEQSTQGTAMSQKKSPFIVIIDDSPIVCRIVEVALSREGYTIASFQDPVLALQAILITGMTPMPDLVFVDLELPRLNGYEVIQLFRKHPTSKHLPLVILSRSDGVLARLKGRLAGATAHLAKPFKTQLLVDVVKQLTNKPT